MDTSRVDLLALLERDGVTLRKVSTRDGGEWQGGPCPFCGESGRHKPDRFHAWPAAATPRFWCRQCERTGDAIAYVRERRNLSYSGALDALGLASNGNGTAAASSALTPDPILRPAHDPAYPPAEEWQCRALAFCQEAEDYLWQPAGARALAWLRNDRGLTDDTIRAASLGYNPLDRYEDRTAWALPPAEDDQGRPKRVWLPRGVVIPWVIAGELWRVNIRRPAGDPKYIGPAGWHDALYLADTLAPGAPAVLVEGELDALTLYQHAGGIAPAVATGSTAGARRARWIADLARCGRVLVAFDGDDPGEAAARYWLDVLTNGRRWRAYYGKDANGLATAGGDLRAWVLTGLAAAYDQLPAGA